MAEKCVRPVDGQVQDALEAEVHSEPFAKTSSPEAKNPISQNGFSRLFHHQISGQPTLDNRPVECRLQEYC